MTEVRTRMAPSPTGKLHVGTAHTTLFNYLFTRHHSGKFILRIDDSDPVRSKPEFETDIITSLKWLGITWDEGPDIGGPYGPYRQSQRTPIYQKYVNQLLDSQRAYRCFCTREELEAKRKAAESQGKMYVYDQTCKDLTVFPDRPFVVRLLNPNKVVTFVDMVRGEISVDTTNFGDFIITRSDGSALLNLAVVIDDIEMKITHAIRGEDFLNATPYQILIFEALGAVPPQIANLSFIYAPDHSKLSKRHGATGVSEYKDLGYLPEAMVNFLALLGWNPGDDRELFSFAELIKEFDFDKVDKNMPTFNIEKLNWYNGHYLRQKSDADLIQLIKPYFSDPRLPQILPLIKERIIKLSDVSALTTFFITAPQVDPDLFPDKSASLAHLNFALSDFDRLDVEKIKSLGWKVGDFFMSLRIAICGSRSTPPLTETMRILGKEESLKRISTSINLLKPLA